MASLTLIIQMAGMKGLAMGFISFTSDYKIDTIEEKDDDGDDDDGDDARTDH